MKNIRNIILLLVFTIVNSFPAFTMYIDDEIERKATSRRIVDSPDIYIESSKIEWLADGIYIFCARFCKFITCQKDHLLF